MDLKKKMKNFFTLTRKANGGFTLVELIVVIAILAILGGVAVPAYSGYVKKAERANDEALLNEINKAFVSACMMNGANNFGLSNVDAALSGGIFTYTAPYGDSFNSFYEGGEFKVFEALIYNAKIGAFEEATATAMNIYNILKTTYGEEIALLMASNLGAMGAETLLTEAGSVVNWANTFGLADLGGESFNNAYLSYLGVDLSKYNMETEEGQLAAQNALDAAIQRLGGDEDKIVANAVALYAAQNTAGVTSDTVSKWLGGGSTTGNMQANANATTLAEAAAIYGLYMTYQGENFNNEGGQPLKVMEKALTDPTFATWVNTGEGKAELEAYKASMAIVSGATADEDAKNSILTNGLDDPELIKVLESLMGN